MKKLFLIFATVFSFSNYALPQTLVISDTGVRFVSPSDNTDVEKINFLGKKSSVRYVPAILENGKKIKVPVVNSLIPTLELHSFEDGSFLRVYHYDKRNRYSNEPLLKFKTINYKSSFFNINPSLESEKVIFQESVPATGLTN